MFVVCYLMQRGVQHLTVKPFVFEKAPTNSLLEQVEEVTKKYVKSVDETCKQREKEILAG